MAKNSRIQVSGIQISELSIDQSDFISFTDFARYKDEEHTDTIILNWMRNCNTFELLGFLEAIYNPLFKPLRIRGV